MSPYAGVPGVIETREALGETTLVVDPARLVEACTFLRDEHGFNFLSDGAAPDYLGWGAQEVAGYIGTASGQHGVTSDRSLACLRGLWPANRHFLTGVPARPTSGR